MTHIFIEKSQAVWVDFDIDDKYTVQQIQKFIGTDDEFSEKSSSEIIRCLKQHGVNIHNYYKEINEAPLNHMHINDKDGKKLLD